MQVPFFSGLEKAKSVLLAGAGGGFDIYAGLPLLHWLEAQGKTVHLANLSFVELGSYSGRSPIRELLTIDEGSRCASPYCPELTLSRWLRQEGRARPVHAIARVGAAGVRRAYRWLYEELGFDTVILIDGGTDILMRGDEPALGTPQEDIASLLAAEALPPSVAKYVVCVGFGVDTFHGVSHGCALENIAAMAQDGGYLGAWSLTREMEESKFYCQAVDYATAVYPSMPSIVNKSVACSIEGWFGNRHFTSRTAGSELFLSPLMALCWAFKLEAISSRLLYSDLVRETEGYFDLDLAIDRFRSGLEQVRPWTDIPH